MYWAKKFFFLIWIKKKKNAHKNSKKQKLYPTPSSVLPHSCQSECIETGPVISLSFRRMKVFLDYYYYYFLSTRKTNTEVCCVCICVSILLVVGVSAYVCWTFLLSPHHPDTRRKNLSLFHTSVITCHCLALQQRYGIAAKCKCVPLMSLWSNGEWSAEASCPRLPRPPPPLLAPLPLSLPHPVTAHLCFLLSGWVASCSGWTGYEFN